MTLEQIRAANDEQINLAVAALQNGRCLDYSRDLNAAMTLVPQGDDYEKSEFDEWIEAIAEDGDSIFLEPWEWWIALCPNKPRALCEAFLLWKGRAT